MKLSKKESNFLLRAICSACLNGNAPTPATFRDGR